MPDGQVTDQLGQSAKWRLHHHVDFARPVTELPYRRRGFSEGKFTAGNQIFLGVKVLGLHDGHALLF